jgi:diguanylate cyclase (GGDEF)-like protein
VADELTPRPRLSPARSGRVSGSFADRLEQYGASGRLMRRVREVTDDGAPAPVARQPEADLLTGLLNRRGVRRRVARLLDEQSADVWVLRFDLDGFQSVNDALGHEGGDEVLALVADRLRAVLPADAPAARIGGDDFLVAWAGGQDEALRLADHVRGIFAEPFRVAGTDVTVTASIGVAHGAGDDEPAATFPQLLRQSDAAMYLAKRGGSDSVTVRGQDRSEELRDRMELEAELRIALAEGQLHVEYQPIVQLDTGRARGAEAFVRWTHPTRGLIPPNSFLPIAEESELIAQIGARVREESLRRLAGWRTDGTVTDNFYLSVNLSSRELNDPDFPHTLADELRRFELPAAAVTLELDESITLDVSRVFRRALSELRSMGVGLLVSNFGSGYSSLSYLHSLPVTGLKIYRDFVAGLGQRSGDDPIVHAIVQLSHALGLTVVADGVETKAQSEALAALGVTLGQGWLWGPAVPAAEFPAAGTAAPDLAPGDTDELIRTLEELLKSESEAYGS